MAKKTIKIWKLNNGWYDFKNVPQKDAKIDKLNAGTDEAALKKAKEINSDYDYEIRDIVDVIADELVANLNKNVKSNDDSRTD